MDTAKRHQMAIAHKTLKMTPVMARIMGGMTFEEAYRVVFNRELLPRLKHLADEYGNSDSLSWELGKYGWKPAELLAAL